jgi:hypothetical protein
LATGGFLAFALEVVADPRFRFAAVAGFFTGDVLLALFFVTGFFIVNVLMRPNMAGPGIKAAG